LTLFFFFFFFDIFHFQIRIVVFFMAMDANHLKLLESKSEKLSEQLSTYISKIQQQMQQMLASTAEYKDIHSSAAKSFFEDLETSTKKSVELIAHCDELDKDLSQLNELSRQMNKILNCNRL
ncbi:hypothetical protein BY458DRAFT_499673, partial [Sporodiniella umbellata]